MAHRDRISNLPEELLLRILSSLPAKDVVVTMVLAKRWKLLWMLVPRLEYDHAMYQDDFEGSRFSRFVHSSLLLHEAPFLESLRLKLDRNSAAADIGVRVKTAVKRSVRELDIDINRLNPILHPWSLYSAGCRMLVTLTLSNTTLVDTSSSSSPASFTSLKKLSLVQLKYPSEDFVLDLLSNCPVLEDLVVERRHNDNVVVVPVIVPSLRRLYLSRSTDIEEDKSAGFVIDAPLLESLDISDENDGGFCYIRENMPEILFANLDIDYIILWKFLGCITSVKRLYLCSSTRKVQSCSFHHSAFLDYQNLPALHCCKERLFALFCFRLLDIVCWRYIGCLLVNAECLP